jgi:hypothetical protein
LAAIVVVVVMAVEGRMCMGMGWVVGEEERCKKREGKGRRRGVYSRSDVSFQ